MKVFSILLLTILGTALTVFAAPRPEPEANPVPKPVARPKPFPGEFAMIEAREVFEGEPATGPDGATKRSAADEFDPEDDGPDSVEAIPKFSPNERDTESLFKRAPTCPWNYWYCNRVKGCCKRSPEYRCCDFGCCRPGYYCCGWDGRCWRSWMC